jgi:hypothetical protein
MTQEEKSLLLQDLSARVPYDIMVEQTLFPQSLADKEQRLKSVQANNVVQLYWYKYINEFVPIHCIKPYLRSMSSMTDEEKKEYKHIAPGIEIENGVRIPNVHQIDWLNEHHFDFRNLIDKGLAIDCTNLNIY